MTRLVAYGTRGFLVEGLVPEGPERARRLAVFAELLRGRLPRAEVVVGAGMLGVFGASSREELTAACDELDPARLEGEGLGTEHRIEVAYDGPDLAELSARTGLAERELIELHSGAEYQVEFLGFAPGFAYLGGLDPRLRLPRRGTPRPRVAAGSLAIAEGYTGIYPFDGPGGWHLLGRTLGAEIFEPSREPAARLCAGDRVRFVESTAPSEFELRVRPRPGEVAGSHLLIERSEGFVTVQDGGRPGRLAEGLPRSGAISPLALRLANESVGNAPDAAGLEILFGSVQLVANAPVWCSVDGSEAHRLAPGESLRVASEPWASRFLAFSGGLDVPRVSGSRSTLPLARLGGHAGRALRAGDRLVLGEVTRRHTATMAGGEAEPHDELEREVADGGLVLPLHPGPHASLLGDAFEEVVRGTFRVSRLADRVGMRLEGQPIAGNGVSVEPTPLVRGAIQLTPDGQLIVFGPDHPITGGYPLVGVLELPGAQALGRCAVGTEVRFRMP